MTRTPTQMQRTRRRTLVEAIAAVIDRPRYTLADLEPNATRPCDCADCQRRINAWKRCRACGYAGAPIVQECVCEVVRRQNIDDLRSEIAKPVGAEPNASRIRSWLEEVFVRENAKPIPMPRCTRDGLAPGRSKCGHGATMCPVCGDLGDGYPLEGLEVEFFAGMLREVRLAISGADGPPMSQRSRQKRAAPRTKKRT